jgi:hypothetical protein
VIISFGANKLLPLAKQNQNDVIQDIPLFTLDRKARKP